MPLPRATPLGHGPDHLHADRVDFEVPRDRSAVARIRHHTAEADTRRDHAIDLGQCELPLGSRHSIFDRADRASPGLPGRSAGTPARCNRARSFVQLSGRKAANAYCGATPTG
jgi:hypothetical protein